MAKPRKAIKVACRFQKRLNYYQYDSLHTPHFKIKGGMLKEMFFFLGLDQLFRLFLFKKCDVLHKMRNMIEKCLIIKHKMMAKRMKMYSIFTEKMA